MIKLVDILASGIKDAVGEPLAGGTVTSYLAGTTTLETLYEDFELDDPHSNPLTLDAAGMAVAYSTERVKLVFHNSSGTLVRTINNVGTNNSDVPSSTEQVIPAGFIGPYAGNSVPLGWLACDGSEVSRTIYANLFANIGTLWGAGNGATTFTLPDFRGRTAIGDGTGTGLTARTLGANLGAEEVTLTGAQSGIAAHNHTQNAHNHLTVKIGTGNQDPITNTVSLAYKVTGVGDADYTLIGRNETADTGLSSSTTATNNAVSDTTALSAHTNMQPSAVAKFIIKT